jgi:competence protein ComEC
MRKLACFAFAFSAAIFLISLSDTLAIICAAAFAILLATALCLGVLHKRAAPFVSVIALGAILGGLWLTMYNQLFIEPALTLCGDCAELSAVVLDYSEPRDYGMRTEVKILRDDMPSPRALVYEFGADRILEPGQLITLKGRVLSSGKETENDYFFSRGIPLFVYAEGSADDCGEIPYANLRYFHRIAARKINDKIEEIFPPFCVGIMQAVLTGTRTRLNDDSYLISVLRTAGAAHIVAVSGMHLVFLVGMLRLVLGRGRAGNLMCVPLVLLFMALTGFTPSVVRAGVMQITLLIGISFRWEYDDITALALALLILCAANPMSVKNGGLQLSFAATLGMLLFSNRLYNYLLRPFRDGVFTRFYKGKWIRKGVCFVVASVSSSLSALAFTIPLSAVMFGSVSVVAPLTNFLVLWAVSLMFASGAAAVALGFVFSPIGHIAAFVAAAFAWYIKTLASALASLPFAAVYTISPYVKVWLVFMYAEFAALYFMKGVRARLALFAASNLIVLAAATGFGRLEAGLGRVTATVLNVGQGQSVALRSEGCSVLVDCGGDLYSNAGDIAAEYFASIGENSLDALILTHFHSDHVNGVIELMNRMRVATLIIPELNDEEGGFRDFLLNKAEEQEVNVVVVGDGPYEYSFGCVESLIIPPLGGKEMNEMGLSAVFTSGDFDLVITGDMNYDTEYRLTEYTELPDAEVFIAGHHGSKTSNSYELLNVIKPECVIISLGENNYGHPSREVMQRFESVGAAVYRTDLNGNVTVRLGEGD